MINKETRNKILDRYSDKNDKIFLASILDLCNKFEVSNHILHTSFLNIKETNIAISIFNMLEIKYTLFKPTIDSERSVIFLKPDYIEDINFDEYICCLKLSPPKGILLKHKDYMGAIYNLRNSRKNDW